jgi:hypothetical protein
MWLCPAIFVAEDVDWLLDRAATYLQARGEPRAARIHSQRAYDRRRARQGDDHPDTLVSASNLATDLHDLGHHQQAHDLDHDTFNRRRRVLGANHLDTLTSANNLAIGHHVEHQRHRK